MTSHFRSEIAGLRAIAVISVILFHLEVSAFQGGFIGVDVFFVISGYLITRNILLDLNAGRFSFGRFYARRTLRIYPALIFTVVATYLAGILWCSAEMLRGLAKESTHALLSISNIQYWREYHQYFAPKSTELALLHCWSLSLEEQFYLFWPVLIVLARKLGRTFGVIAIVGIASFLFSIFISKSDPRATFFLMPFRIFEFAIGASVLFLETRFRLGEAAAESMSAAGMLCVIASALVVKSDTPHLDVAILLPCLGAAATIWAGDRTRTSMIFANRAMVGIGTISYSLYLCHWPILYFARFIFGEEASSSPTGILSSVVVMIVTASAMNRYVERKFIRPSESSRPPRVWRDVLVFWSVLLTLVAITHITFLSEGFAWRLPKSQRELAHLEGFPTSHDLEPVVEPLGLVLLGDSYAEQYIAGLALITKPLNVGIDILTFRGCPMLLDVALKSFERDRCMKGRDKALERLEHTDLPIVFAQSWNAYNDKTADFAFDAADTPPRDSIAKLQLAIERTIEKIGSHGRRILIIGDQINASCNANARRLRYGPLPHKAEAPCRPTARDVAELDTAPVNQMLARIQAKWPDQIEVLRPVDYFCDRECPAIKDGIWLYSDQNHFSVAGSRYMGNRAADVFRKFLAK